MSDQCVHLGVISTQTHTLVLELWPPNLHECCTMLSSSTEADQMRK
jgi:hypothetical protein